MYKYIVIACIFFPTMSSELISFYLESKTNLKQETNVEILLSVNQLLVSFVSASLILLLRSDDEEIATDIILQRYIVAIII